MKKKLIMLIAIAALLTQVTILPANTAFANNKPIEIEGKLVNGRVLIPLRAFSENMGSKVQWDNKEKMAYIQKENKVISLELNGMIISIDGLPNGYLLDVPMTMIGQTTYVPFSYMSSVMGASVTWNNQIKQAKVMNKDNSILLINAKPDHSVTLPTAPSQKRLDQLYAKVNEAANITAYTQKRQQLTGYFTN